MCLTAIDRGGQGLSLWGCAVYCPKACPNSACCDQIGYIRTVMGPPEPPTIPARALVPAWPILAYCGQFQPAALGGDQG